MAPERPRVLGIDPGLTRCGLGVVEGPPMSPQLVATACVRTDPGQPLEQRLLIVHDAIEQAIATHRPTAVAVEQVLFSVNVRTAMATGQAAGVALLAAARAGLPVHPYTPSDVKLTVAGDGGAEKGAVARMVAAHLGLATPPTPADVADALAVALTHLAKMRIHGATPASNTAAVTVAQAHAEGARARRGGWEALVAARGLQISGGTRTTTPARPTSSTTGGATPDTGNQRGRLP